jgi:hypothetical protein
MTNIHPNETPPSYRNKLLQLGTSKIIGNTQTKLRLTKQQQELHPFSSLSRVHGVTPRKSVLSTPVVFKWNLLLPVRFVFIL